MTPRLSPSVSPIERSEGRPAFVLLILMVLVLPGCDNMTHQEHVRPEDPSNHFADGASARKAPAHTVPAGPAEAPRPERITLALLERGQEEFRAQCSECHGEDGYGRGIVVERGFPAPPSLHDTRLREASAEHIHDVIERGYGAMYPAGYRMAPADRWAVVAYVRALQLSQHATLADVPADRRGGLDR